MAPPLNGRQYIWIKQKLINQMEQIKELKQIRINTSFSLSIPDSAIYTGKSEEEIMEWIEKHWVAVDRSGKVRKDHLDIHMAGHFNRSGDRMKFKFNDEFIEAWKNQK